MPADREETLVHIDKFGVWTMLPDDDRPELRYVPVDRDGDPGVPVRGPFADRRFPADHEQAEVCPACGKRRDEPSVFCSALHPHSADHEQALEAFARAFEYVPLNLYDEIQKPAENGLGALVAALETARRQANEYEADLAQALVDADEWEERAVAAERERDVYAETVGRKNDQLTQALTEIVNTAWYSDPSRSLFDRMVHVARAALAAAGDADDTECDGSSECKAKRHIHGCFAERAAAASSEGTA